MSPLRWAAVYFLLYLNNLWAFIALSTLQLTTLYPEQPPMNERQPVGSKHLFSIQRESGTGTHTLT